MARRSDSALERAENTSAKRALKTADLQLQVAGARDATSSNAPGAGAVEGGAGPIAAGPAVTFGRVALVDIDVPEDRLRAIDDAWAEVIGRSMREHGQQQPVRLILEDNGRFTLKFGGHRLRGAELAGLSEIDAGWVRRDWADQQSSRVPEIIENLIRNDLDALSRAHHLAEYKAIHDALHPEHRHGGDRRSARAKARGDQVAIFAFRTEAAEKTGLSERAIQLAVAIWNGLSPQSRRRLSGTALAANQAALKAIAELAHPMQAQVLDLLLSTPAGAGSVADAVLLAQGKRPPSASDKLFRSVSGGLTRLSAANRATLWETYEEEILATFRRKGILP